MSVFYITAIPLPRGARTVDNLPRIDLGRFFTKDDAEAHMDRFNALAFYDRRIEERDEPDAV